MTASTKKLCRELWRDTGLSQREISRRLGVHERQVRYYMNGHREAPDVFLFALRALAAQKKAAELAIEYWAKAKSARAVSTRSAWNEAAFNIATLIVIHPKKPTPQVSE